LRCSPVSRCCHNPFRKRPHKNSGEGTTQKGSDNGVRRGFGGRFVDGTEIEPTALTGCDFPALARGGGQPGHRAGPNSSSDGLKPDPGAAGGCDPARGSGGCGAERCGTGGVHPGKTPACREGDRRCGAADRGNECAGGDDDFERLYSAFGTVFCALSVQPKLVGRVSKRGLCLVGFGFHGSKEGGSVIGGPEVACDGIIGSL